MDQCKRHSSRKTLEKAWGNWVEANEDLDSARKDFDFQSWAARYDSFDLYMCTGASPYSGSTFCYLPICFQNDMGSVWAMSGKLHSNLQKARSLRKCDPYHNTKYWADSHAWWCDNWLSAHLDLESPRRLGAKSPAVHFSLPLGLPLMLAAPSYHALTMLMDWLYLLNFKTLRHFGERCDSAHNRLFQ